MDEDLGQRLVRAGVELLDDGGLEVVGIREVARRCGVSHGAPRRWFPTRSALLADIARAGFADLERAVAGGGTDLRSTARAYLAFAVDRPHLFDLLTRHDLLDGSGRGLRHTSRPLVEIWVTRYRAEHASASDAEALAAWAAVHGVASLASRRSLEVLDIRAEDLLGTVLARWE